MANIVTTSKALVTSSDAPVTSSILATLNVSTFPLRSSCLSRRHGHVVMVSQGEKAVFGSFEGHQFCGF